MNARQSDPDNLGSTQNRQAQRSLPVVLYAFRFLLQGVESGCW